MISQISLLDEKNLIIQERIKSLDNKEKTCPGKNAIKSPPLPPFFRYKKEKLIKYNYRMKLYSIISLLLCIHYKNQEFQGIYV